MSYLQESDSLREIRKMKPKYIIQSLATALQDHGYETDVDDDCVYAHNSDFYVRIVFNKFIQAGVRKSFDRWANSVDFEGDFPIAINQLNRFLSEVQKEYEAGNFDEGWAKTKHLPIGKPSHI